MLIYVKWSACSNVCCSNGFSLDPPRANGSLSELMQAFDNVIVDFMMEQDIPGASVALSRDGRLVYCQGIKQIIKILNLQRLKSRRTSNWQNSHSLSSKFTTCTFAAYFP